MRKLQYMNKYYKNDDSIMMCSIDSERNYHIGIIFNGGGVRPELFNRREFLNFIKEKKYKRALLT